MSSQTSLVAKQCRLQTWALQIQECQNRPKDMSVDDFSFRKRYTYGTVMVDLETHRIVDIIDSRETKQVEEWLKTYSNLNLVSRDGAQTYASAIRNAHPNAVQVSDCFHLIKNLSDAVERYLYRLFPSRLVIQVFKVNPEMEAFYDTRNRSERTIFEQKKRSEGYTVNDIALLLHSSQITIEKYLTIPENEIPVAKENLCERQHIQQMENKKASIMEVCDLYDKEHGLTGHTVVIIMNYLR